VVDLLNKGADILLHDIGVSQGHFLIECFPGVVDVLLKGFLG